MHTGFHRRRIGKPWDIFIAPCQNSTFCHQNANTVKCAKKVHNHCLSACPKVVPFFKSLVPHCLKNGLTNKYRSWTPFLCLLLDLVLYQNDHVLLFLLNFKKNFRFEEYNQSLRRNLAEKFEAFIYFWEESSLRRLQLSH